MKNIITTIAMFILTITAQAQTITTDSFFKFTHDPSISTYESSVSGKYVTIGWFQRKMKYEIYEQSIVRSFIENGVDSVEYLTVNKIVKEGGEVQYFVTSQNGVNGDIILSKETERNLDIIVSRFILDGKMVVTESYIN